MVHMNMEMEINMVKKFYGDGDQHGLTSSMEMEITMRTRAILIHNYVLPFLTFYYYVRHSRSRTIPHKFRATMPYQLNLALSHVLYDWWWVYEIRTPLVFLD